MMMSKTHEGYKNDKMDVACVFLCGAWRVGLMEDEVCRMRDG